MTYVTFLKTFGATIILVGAVATSTVVTAGVNAKSKATPPASKFDMSHWKITVPVDENGDKKPDEIEVEDMKNYSNPDFFYLDEDGAWFLLHQTRPQQLPIPQIRVANCVICCAAKTHG